MMCAETPEDFARELDAERDEQIADARLRAAIDEALNGAPKRERTFLEVFTDVALLPWTIPMRAAAQANPILADIPFMEFEHNAYIYTRRPLEGDATGA